MSVTFRHGDIFDSQCQVLVNPVNCVGVMGAGLALEFRHHFGQAYFRDYYDACMRGALTPGHPYLHRLPGTHWVLDFPTKGHHRNPSCVQWIEDGLAAFVRNYERAGITSIAFPRLGCGLGGLVWPHVRFIMVRYLDPLPIPVEIYE